MRFTIYSCLTQEQNPKAQRHCPGCGRDPGLCPAAGHHREHLCNGQVGAFHSRGLGCLSAAALETCLGLGLCWVGWERLEEAGHCSGRDAVEKQVVTLVAHLQDRGLKAGV